MLLQLLACAASPAPSGPHPVLEFGAGAPFWDSPFPGDHRLDRPEAGLDALPGRGAVPFVEDLLALVDPTTGFGTTSPLHLRLTAPLVDGATDDPATLVRLVPTGTWQDHPVELGFESDGGPFGAADLLTVLPQQGRPLRPGTTYTLFVLAGPPTAQGPLVESPAVTVLRAGDVPYGLSRNLADLWRSELDRAEAAGVAVAGVVTFTTGRPADDLATITDAVRQAGFDGPEQWTVTDVFDTYCVAESTVTVPVFQVGEPPYLTEGGRIPVEDGPPVDHWEAARLWVTVPRAPMPSGGWPTVVMVRTGGGGDRPLVDRGVRDAEGNVEEPGSGPALHITAAGYAGAMMDGPHGGLRNVSGGDEQFIVFNVSNPAALRDNLRQSSAELALLPALLDGVRPDLSPCPGADPAPRFDAQVLLGHSMGATIGPPAAAQEPRYRALVLSGAGGSWIENIVWKEKPLEVRPLAEAMLGYPSVGASLDVFDPVLGLLQWAGEGADPPVFHEQLVDRDVLMVQGIVDHYILPPIANSLSVALELTLAGSALDATVDEVAHHTPFLDASGGQSVQFPTTGRVLVQHPEDGVEDGHEVFYQLPDAHHQLQCFLATRLTGAAVVVEGAGAACD